MSEQITPAPSDTGPPATTKSHNSNQHTRVSWADPNPNAELDQLRYRLAKSKLRTSLAEEQAKRIFIWLGALSGVAAVVLAIVERIWAISHPVSNFDLVVSNATIVASGAISCASLYLRGRFGKGPSDPGDSLADAAASVVDEAEKLTQSPEGS